MMAELPGTPTAAKYVSRDSFRVEVQYDATGDEWHHYRRDRHRDVVEAVEAVITPEAYVPPPAPVPASVTAYQARMALKAASLLATVNTTIAALDEDDDARIAWEYATTVERESPLLTTWQLNLVLQMNK